LILSKVKSKTLQDLLKVLSGNVAAQGIGFLTIILISRDLGPEQYGVFSLLLAIFTISIQISDFGISTSYVKYLSENLSKAKEIFFTVVVSKIVLSFIIILSLYFLSEYISVFFFESDIYTKLIQLISVAILFHSIYGVIVANLQAKQHIKQFAFMHIFHNLLKILAVVFISFSFIQNEHLEYFIYAYSFSVVFILMFLLLTNIKNLSFKNHFDFTHFIEIYKLGFWIFLSALATMVIMRLDIMMLTKMSTSQEAGYYSVAMNLAMVFPLITASLTATLLPKMESFLKNNSTKEYIFKILAKAKYVLLGLIIMEILSPYLITLIFGIEYIHSIRVFQIILIAFTFGIIVNPIALVIYSINKAYVLTLLNWIQLPLNYFGNILLIPLFQADGAAISTVGLKTIGGIYIITYLLKVKNDK
jgi:O-antigen/teichoic acid export membrane protein